MLRRFSFPQADDLVDREFVSILAEMERRSSWLDDRFRVPWTNIRFGIDPIVGMIPVVGDLVMAGVSLHLVAQARRLGADSKLLRRMLSNVGVDVLLGLLPFVGVVLDLFFRANNQNMKLLIEAIRTERGRDAAADR
ncbi:MAG: DUF4112 domain-containing protein [Hyphomicrobiaceae bacterium]|nr:DUF4112 domain-containing protein [Hyphomicrobiaceae bacterium]